MSPATSTASGTVTARHRIITARLLVETVVLLLGATWAAITIAGTATGSAAGAGAAAATAVGDPRWWWLYAPVLLFQALLFQRLYIIGHEASHRKLVPGRPRLNDLVGQVMMLPILIPVRIYRQVHMFHHGFNRRDHHSSALDVFVSPWPVTIWVRAYYTLLWYVGVFAGGYFLHSVASVILFLFVPTSRAERVSPAFKRWGRRDRLMAWTQFVACAAFVVGLGFMMGWEAWRLAWLYPFLAFAWVWSLVVYIFHYHTTLGEHTRFNVRALRQHGVLSWLWMNFNQHASHHMAPHIPWYELPDRRQELPAPFEAKNQNTDQYGRAILQQLAGPTIVHSADRDPTPHLFVRWED
jgi:fatty acid desaturase